MDVSQIKKVVSKEYITLWPAETMEDYCMVIVLKKIPMDIDELPHFFQGARVFYELPRAACHCKSALHDPLNELMNCFLREKRNSSSTILCCTVSVFLYPYPLREKEDAEERGKVQVVQEDLFYPRERV